MRGPPGSRSPPAAAPPRPRLQSRARCRRPAPALTLRGLSGAEARRGAVAPGPRGEMQRLVQTPSPPRRSPAASAAGSRSVTRAATPLPPALPMPLSARVDLSRLRSPPSTPQPSALSPAGVRWGRPGPASPTAYHAPYPLPARAGGVCWGGGSEWRNTQQVSFSNCQKSVCGRCHATDRSIKQQAHQTCCKTDKPGINKSESWRLVQDGGVEGHALTPSCESTGITTNC
nr:nascent polypeptide-associated complex subunit alpha, muscle-specific form-like [Globicephala melas]